MLLFRKIISLRGLKLQLFKNYSVSINNISSYPNYLIHCNSYCSNAAENKYFALNEIQNLAPTIFKGNDEKTTKMYEICDEILKAKSKGRLQPEFIKLCEVDELFSCETKSKRQSYLTFLFKKERAKLNNAEKKLKKKLEYEEELRKLRTAVAKTNHIHYGIGHNSLLLQAFKRNLLRYYEKKLAKSILFGQKIVIDLGYEDYMCNKEKKECAAQLKLLYSHNRYHREPYDLYFCNANSKGKCVQYLQQMLNENKKLQILWEESYLDLFPNENLVYLSPHASETLKTYDHEAIYIIGGFVDTQKRPQISMRKAEGEGIKSYSLPLDEHVLWGLGSRSLTINQVFSIMQEMRDANNWKEAFKHIPMRKLKKVNSDSVETLHCPDKLFVMSN